MTTHRITTLTRTLATTVLLISSAAQNPAQTPAQSPAPPPPPATTPTPGAIASHPVWPAARPADVDSIEHLIAALYDVISGPAHQLRDWDRMRSLFLPGARLVPVRTNAAAADVLFLSVDDYITRAAPRMEADGFYERSIHNQVEQFNHIVSVFSTYESRHAQTDPTPFARGINSINLLKSGNRYWIEQVYWDADHPDSPIPAKYLPTTTPPAVSRIETPTPFENRAAARLAGHWQGNWTGHPDSSHTEPTNNASQPLTLPTQVTITASSDGRALTLDTTRGQAPGNVLHQHATLTLFPTAHMATLSSEGEHTATAYTLTGFDDFARKGGGTLQLTSQDLTSQPSSRPTEQLLTLTLSGPTLIWARATRPAHSTGAYEPQDTYTLTPTP